MGCYRSFRVLQSFIDITIINPYVGVSSTGTNAEYRLVVFVRYINQRANATVGCFIDYFRHV